MRARRWAGVAVLGAGLMAMAGCAVNKPVAEVTMFSQAVGAVETASEPLLDDLSAADKVQGQRAYRATARTKDLVLTNYGTSRVEGFDPSYAYYYSSLSDSQAVLALRGGLRAVRSYADVLTLMAGDGNLDQARGELASIGTNLLSLAGLATTALPGVDAALGALKGVIDEALSAANAQELRRIVLAGAPQVKAVVAALRNGSAAMFRSLTFDASNAFDTAANPAAAQAAARQIDGYRVAVSDYVVLLDRVSQALDQLVASYQTPSNPYTLANLAERSAALGADAQAWRRAYAALRRGGN